MKPPTEAPSTDVATPVARFSPRYMAAKASRALRRLGTRRVRTPTVLQMEAVECGAAALAMVLAYYEKFVPLEELRVACGVSRDGSKASNMVKAGRRYGLDSAGYRKEPNELRSCPLPAIVHWNFNHFVVLDGFSEDKVFLNDPATGPRTVTAQEFDEAFTGVVLTFRRGPEFVRSGAASSMLPALRSRLIGSGAAVLFVVLAGIALAVPSTVVPTFTRVFIDQVLVRELVSWTKPLFVAMGVATLLIAALTAIQQQHLLRLETKFALSTSASFFWHVLRLPIQFFTQRSAGEIGSRVALNDRIAQLLSGDLATTALNALVLLVYAGLMVQYDVMLTSVAIAIAGLNIVALKYVSRKRTDLNRRLLQDQGKLIGTAVNGLMTIETLKAMGAESDFFSRWSGQQAKVVNAQQELALQTQTLSLLPPFLLAVNTAVLLGLGGMRVMDGRLSIGLLIAFQALMLGFIGPINKMVDLASTMQEVRGDLSRLDDVLGAARDPNADIADPDTELPADGVVGAVRTKLSGRVELRDVTFGYSPLDPPLIEGMNLSLRPGSRVALVGGSGSGKSTVARLVSGLHQPWRGEILFDGVSREKIPRSIMTTSFAVVDQDIFLFEDSIKENVTLWDSSVAESDMIQAARDSAIHDDVTARSGGYNSRVEEAGRNFSGGQRQRLEITRALAGNPTILVLDEATSALDPQTESLIDDNLRRRGCTCLLVAHRLSTIRDCDEIIVLQRGKIVQRGTHDTMKDVAGPYRDLIAAE